MKWLDIENVRERATSEEFAKDSYENLIFSICRYHEFTGNKDICVYYICAFIYIC